MFGDSGDDRRVAGAPQHLGQLIDAVQDGSQAGFGLGRRSGHSDRPGAGGDHEGMHQAGQDLTDAQDDAPHGVLVTGFPEVGRLV